MFNIDIILKVSSKVEGFTAQPIRHWTVAKMRKYMEKFARAKSMDPLLSETWYKTSYEELYNDPVCLLPIFYLFSPQSHFIFEEQNHLLYTPEREIHSDQVFWELLQSLTKHLSRYEVGRYGISKMYVELN